MYEGNFPHLFVITKEVLGYRSPQSAQIKFKIKSQDRVAHSQYLIQRFNEAWQAQDSENNQAVSLPARDGMYLEFKSESDYDLVVKSLEDIRHGVRLLSVRTEKTAEGNEITLATIYMPSNRVGHFLRKIEAYTTKETSTGKPRHEKLFSNIGDIQKAVLKSFWQDNPQKIPGEQRDWYEVWLFWNTENKQEILEHFQRLLPQMGIPFSEKGIDFPERSVFAVHANASDLARLITASPSVAEFRSKESPAFWVELPNVDQTQWSQDLVGRLRTGNSPTVSVCILDTGVNNGHPLLQPLLTNDDCQTYEPRWHTHDHDKHGTLMAGLAAFGNLQQALETAQPVEVNHCLESVKILPPSGQNNPDLYASITAQGISLAEIQAPKRSRVICMAVSADRDIRRGRPSSWSAEIDKLAAGMDDDKRRLIILSAGNVRNLDEWKVYPHSNKTLSIEDPGQAWNALTVGAYTSKTVIQDPHCKNYIPVASSESLSPFSTTSLEWEKKWPMKPDVVFEGGNLCKDPQGHYTEHDDLSLLSTFYMPQIRHFHPHSGTSAATAYASWMAAQIQLAYPDIWPESIRGLIVHSAQWTPAMKRDFLTGSNKNDYANLVRICGFGVPSLREALSCAANSLTLISQQGIQPYEKGRQTIHAKDMHLYELPWPREALLALGDTLVELRVTLSYFIEPGPGEVGWNDRYRYPSHGLRFDVNASYETKPDFCRRINMAARQEEEETRTTGDASGWCLGIQNRSKGSIHSDIWRGSATELATSNLIGVYPSTGWWKTRSHLGCCNKTTRYSLLVSIRSPEMDVDLYTPVRTQLRVPITVSVQHDERSQ
jgi:hypothetical protein